MYAYEFKCKVKFLGLTRALLVCLCVHVHLVYLSNCVLSFHKHGMQGKSLVTQQVRGGRFDNLWHAIYVIQGDLEL